MFINKLSPFATWHIKQVFYLIACAVLLLWVYPKTNLDFDLISPYYDVDNKIFSLKNDAFLTQVMHVGLRNFVIFIALMTLFLATFGHKLKLSALVRRQLIWSFAGMMLSTLAVSILKSQSMHACPWDLIQFGGNFPFYPLFANLPKGEMAGHCWPGGHASGGFALMAFFFAFRRTHPIFAYVSLVISLMLGFVMGWTQMLRGAHFLSHSLWSAWVVWLVLLILSACCMPNLVIKKQTEYRSLDFTY
jgi:membrane-associated PAP2 superfamily phosphatase